MSQEARELIQRARDPDDLSWQLGEGIQVTIKFPVPLDISPLSILRSPDRNVNCPFPSDLKPSPIVQEPLEVDLGTEERTRAMQYEVPYKGYTLKTDVGLDSIK